MNQPRWIKSKKHWRKNKIFAWDNIIQTENGVIFLGNFYNDSPRIQIPKIYALASYDKFVELPKIIKYVERVPVTCLMTPLGYISATEDQIINGRPVKEYKVGDNLYILIGKRLYGKNEKHVDLANKMFLYSLIYKHPKKKFFENYNIESDELETIPKIIQSYDRNGIRKLLNLLFKFVQKKSVHDSVYFKVQNVLARNFLVWILNNENVPFKVRFSKRHTSFAIYRPIFNALLVWCGISRNIYDEKFLNELRNGIPKAKVSSIKITRIYRNVIAEAYGLGISPIIINNFLV